MSETPRHDEGMVAAWEDRKSHSVAALRDEIIETRGKVVATIAQADHLLLQEIPQIKADYAVRVGCYQVRLLEAELACRRAKRKLALVQAQLNRGEAADLGAIDSQLDHALVQWQTRVGEAYSQLNEGLARITGQTALSPADTQKMKNLYRTLVKRLHPDLNASQPEEAAALFQMVMHAYEAGQLEVLQALEVSTRRYERGDTDLDGLSVDELALALELAKAELSIMEARLGKLLEDPLFELKQNLANPDWLAKTVGALKKSTAEFDEARRKYEERLAALLDARG